MVQKFSILVKYINGVNGYPGGLKKKNPHLRMNSQFLSKNNGKLFKKSNNYSVYWKKTIGNLDLYT